MTEYDISEAFRKIENELIDSMIRNMDRHRAEEDKEGILWSQWQAEQLKCLEQYKLENQKKYGTQFKSLNRQVEVLIETARETGNMEQEIEILEAIKNGFAGYKKIPETMQAEFFRINDRKLDALIRATTDDLRTAETAVLRMANDQYRKAIFNAQVYANTGAGTYAKAVDMATKDMLAAGLNCIEYKNGARHRLNEYADMAIRTASKRAYLTGEGEMRQKWSVTTVIVNKRGNPCPKCLPFCGKVLIDDIWSGGSPKDGSYPLMSKAVEAGLYHPRCKDSHTTYFPGISTADDTWTKKELEEIGQQSKEESRQQYAGRQAEKFERLEKYSLDPENKEKYATRSRTWNKAAEKQFESFEELENHIKEVYNGTVDADVRKLDIRQVSQTLAEFETVMEDFPKTRKFFSGINTYEKGKAAFIPNGELVLNPQIYKSINRKLIGTGYHEAGHLIELTLIRIGNPDLPMDDIYTLYKKGNYARDIVLSAYQRIGTKRRIEELKEEISKYALRNHSETVAEAISDYYMNGYDASILSRQIVKVLKRRLE